MNDKRDFFSIVIGLCVFFASSISLGMIILTQNGFIIESEIPFSKIPFLTVYLPCMFFSVIVGLVWRRNYEGFLPKKGKRKSSFVQLTFVYLALIFIIWWYQ